MRILIVTPLYPPDIADSAQYVKELATRLSSLYTVTILTYGHVPEVIHNVRIVSVEKSRPLLPRLFHFTREFLHQHATADIILALNGPSVELPLFLVSLRKKIKVLFHLYDERALFHAATSWRYRIPFFLASKRAQKILVHDESAYTDSLVKKTDSRVTSISRPLARPEILPLEAYPEKEFAAYQESWVTHAHELTSLIKNI